MTLRKRSYLVLLSAVAAMPLVVRPAMGQSRVDTSGHALDANPQVGSGGYNIPNSNESPPAYGAYQSYQNAIVTGNAGNGYAFEGRIFNGVNMGAGYSDPFAFRGLLAGQGVDQFIANSTGVPTFANPNASSQKYAEPAGPGIVYYGSANHSGPPTGFEQSSNSSNYVPMGQPLSQQPEDTRIGAITFSGNTPMIPRPDELLVPGPVDTSANAAGTGQQGQQNMLRASSLSGVTPYSWSQTPQMLTPNSPDNGQSNGQNGGQTGNSVTPPGTPANSAQDRIKQMQDELRSSSGNGSGQNNGGANGNGSSNGNGPISGGSLSQPLSPVLSNSSQLAQPNLNSQPGNFSTGQSTRETIPLPPPGMQSRQYALLRQAIDQYNSAHSMTDEEANERFQQILRLRQLANQQAEQGGNVLSVPAQVPSENPGGVPNPEQATPPSQPQLPVTPGPGAVPQIKPGALSPNFATTPNIAGGSGNTFGGIAPRPIPIDSFASGIKAKGLADLISNGETLVRKQQYDKAIAAFDQATDVAPNNPLVLMARASAELGGEYYAQASTDIHLAISQDPAVLIGQYDLNRHLGSERVNALIADLKTIAQGSHDDTAHAFLLAFVYYNSRHVGQAADWLAITDDRAQGQDAAVNQMKRYWNFNEDEQPGGAPTTQPAAK
jgi:tetratricopeptide (TPR) repeat protein